MLSRELPVKRNEMLARLSEPVEWDIVVRGVVFRDLESVAENELRTRAVINATGSAPIPPSQSSVWRLKRSGVSHVSEGGRRC